MQNNFGGELEGFFGSGFFGLLLVVVIFFLFFGGGFVIFEE